MKRISVQPFRQNRLSNYSNYNYQFMNKSIDYESLSPARKNQNFPILTRTKTTDRFWFFTNQANQKINERRKDVNYALNKSKHLSKLENNIKKALNNMIIKIEKNNQNENTISPEKLINKRTSNPNLKIFYKIKRTKNKNVNNNLQGSFLIQETCVFDSDIKKIFVKKRNKSLNLTEQNKKKLYKRIRNKIFKKLNNINIINNSKITDSEEIDNNENNRGFSFHPNNGFFLIFDFLLIIADLYTFMVIPLNIAQNKDVREIRTYFKEIVNYSIDIIFLLDFIISLFRGYYNYEMKIIRNNKKIIINYLKNYFCFDFLQAIPLYTIIKLFIKKKEYYYLNNSLFETSLLPVLFFIKPFKIFKIIKKKENKALEDFYSYLSESYYLEELVRFLIYILVFLLSIHLFICLHIYFSLRSFPNWIVHINIINETFFSKYIASLYFMITTMTTVGYGDIVCISSIERIYHIFLLVLGTLLYTFLVSKIGNILRDQSHEQTKLSKDLNILENIRITYPDMSFKLYSKIKRHLLSIFNKRKKTGISLLINGVPDAIKNDLLFKIYSKVINEFKIFKDIKNSNFVLQMLTSFIPIISKKEEIIVLEGEIIQNIIFVKDGRLSMEIHIDLNDPYKSIQNYLQFNFIGISKQEEQNNYTFSNRMNSMIVCQTETNYNELKTRIDMLLSDNKKTLIDNSMIDNNGISVDLGRLDFSRNENEQTLENFQPIKILDIRKNEHFGAIHIFSEKPSPFTIKPKSRIAELLLLRKQNAIILSKNFPNIWRRIETKSYHNLVSIKKLTYKILKRYYNTHIYNKNNKDTYNIFNHDVSNNFDCEFTNLEKRQSYLNELTKNKITRKSIIINNIEKINFNQNDSKNQIINSKLLASGKNNSHIGDTMSDKNNASPYSKSNNSNSYSFQVSKINSFINPAESKTDMVKIKEVINEKQEECNKIQNINNYDEFSLGEIKQINSKKNSIFKKDNMKNNEELNNNSDLQGNNNNEDSLNNKINENNSFDSFVKYNTIKCICKNNDDNLNNDFMNIYTLEDVGRNFSKKIKKKLKRRKKIQKLKEIFKLQKLEINKSIVDLNINNTLGIKNSNKFLVNNENKINYSLSSNNKVVSQILDTTTSEDANTTLIRNSNLKFDDQSLKKVSLNYFQIKSSYKNIYLLSNGEMSKNLEYKKNLENLIERYINKIKSNYKNKKFNTTITPNYNIINYKRYLHDYNNNIFNTSKNNAKFSSLSDNYNKFLSSKYCHYIKNENDEFGYLKDNYFNIERKSNEITNKNKNKLIKGKVKGNSNLLKLKKENILKKEKINNKNNINYNNINYGGLTSTLNIFNETDKDNQLSYLNRKNLESCNNIILDNKSKERKSVNCFIF